MTWPIALLAAAAGYLCGSISFARLVTRLAAPEKDITQTDVPVAGFQERLRMRGVSATSVRTQLPPKYGCLTSVLDMVKVTVPTLVFKLAFPDTSYFLIAAGMGVIGHNWPVYYRFRGGYGSSPIFGGLLVIDWLGVLVSFLVGTVIGGVAKNLYAGFLSSVVVIAPWLWLRTHDWRHLAYGIVVALAYFAVIIYDMRQYRRITREGTPDPATVVSGLSDLWRGLVDTRFGLRKKASQE